ncbi:MAG: hypothetical protein M1822_009727 [Bathelium mastoideum]|nr:MAG: hypothetical protein M1822_009727 [Bathelium mastoideum]
MTLAGLNTINLSTLNTWQQIMLFILIMMGSAIFVSAFVVHVRRRAFESKFRDVFEEKSSMFARRGRRRSTSRSGLSIQLSVQTPVLPAANAEAETSESAGGANRGRQVSKSLELPRSEPGEETIAAEPRSASEQKPTDRSDEFADHHPPRHSESTETTAGDPSVNGFRTDIRVPNHKNVDDGQSSVQRESTRASPERSRGHGVTFDVEAQSPEKRGRSHTNRNSVLGIRGVGARPGSNLRLISPLPPVAFSGVPGEQVSSAETPTSKYFPSAGSISRNSQFHGLTEAERERLGGREYRAIQYLAVVVPLYFILWQLLGSLGIGAYVHNNHADITRADGLNPWWVGAFNAVSAFNNSGMSLLDANMTVFQKSYYMLLTMSLLILAGNTAYPPFLRLIVWTMWKCCPTTPDWHDWRTTLRFLLDHPRRCYTNLFPSRHTWWLLMSIVVLNGTDWAAFEILNIGNPAITVLDRGTEVVDGLFQAVAVRSGGFYVVNISSVRISLQVLYVVMMYISVYPVVITMRNSNVYEERSLGIYADDPGYSAQPSPMSAGIGGLFGGWRRQLTGEGISGQEERGSYFVQQQLRAQLAHDAWFLAFAVFLISIIEGGQFERNPATFSIFNIIFEVVSGYACVGISVGLPYAAYSFCGSWHALSKLILCAVMIRGRHRGLPVAIDKAVLLPGEHSERAEEEDAQIRMERSISRGRGV